MEEEERKEGKKAGIGSVLCTLNVDHGMQTTTTVTGTGFQLLEPSVTGSQGGHKLLPYSSVPHLISIFGPTAIQLDEHSLTIDCRLEVTFTAGTQIPPPRDAGTGLLGSQVWP